MTVPLKRKTRQYSGMVFEKDRSGYSTERLASIPHLSFDPLNILVLIRGFIFQIKIKISISYWRDI